MTRFLNLAATCVAACLLMSCNIEGAAPIRTSDVVGVAKSGAPVAVNATITATFASETWCEDEGAMAVKALGSATTPIVPTSCAKAGNQGTGQFQLSTSMVKTDGAADPNVAVEQVLGDDLVRFAVFPHGKHKHLLSVGLFLNVPRFEAAKAKLTQMPVFKRGGDLGEQTYTIRVNVSNDLQTPAKFYVGDVSTGGDLPSDDAVLTIPPGGSDWIALDADTQAKLLQQGYVNFFAMATK